MRAAALCGPENQKKRDWKDAARLPTTGSRSSAMRKGRPDGAPLCIRCP